MKESFIKARNEGWESSHGNNGDTFEGSHSNHDSHGHGKYTNLFKLIKTYSNNYVNLQS